MTVEEMKEIVRDYNLEFDKFTLIMKSLELLNCELLRHGITDNVTVDFVFTVFKDIANSVKSELETTEDLILSTCDDLIDCYKSTVYKDSKGHIRLVIIE